jgi:hypothetical protein
MLWQKIFLLVSRLLTLQNWDLGRGPFGTLRLILNLNLSYRVDLQAVDLQHVLPADLEELRLVYSVTVTYTQQ